MVLAADTEAWIVIIILLVYEIIEVFLWDISMDQPVSDYWFFIIFAEKVKNFVCFFGKSKKELRSIN